MGPRPAQPCRAGEDSAGVEKSRHGTNLVRWTLRVECAGGQTSAYLMLHVVKRPVAKPADISLRTGRVPNHEEGGQAWGGLHARRPSSRSRPHVWSPSKRPFCCGRPRLHPIPLSLSFDHSEASCFPSSSATAAAATGGDDDCSGSDGGGGSSRDSGSGSGGGASGSGSGGGASGSASGGGGWPRWDAAAAAVSPVTAAAGGAAADGGAAEGGELEMEDATLVTKVPARLSYVLPRRPAAVASGGGGAVAVAVVAPRLSTTCGRRWCGCWAAWAA